MSAGCGRVGYDPVVRGEHETGSGHDGGSEPGRDAAPAESAPDMLALDAVATMDARTPDTAGPPDMAPPVDMAPPPVDMALPPVDMALPRDSAPDVSDTAPAMPPCRSFPAGDMIADFESGTLATNPVGSRGGTTFHLVDDSLGSLRNEVLPYCGQRAMRILANNVAGGSRLVQAILISQPAGSGLYVDARGYQGVTLAFRASTPIAVRVKLPNRDTLNGGNDHFQAPFTAGTNWDQGSFSFATFRQNGAATQFPRFDVSALGAIEISASLPPGASLWVDEIAFLR
jgi:hypothetical protein